ncbi:MAG: hypothetical protein MUO82_07420 [Candidatus Thermoplasmatota archaeon]|nr:hypothetical protein [Candidatus Thermoplasmatota archaeon]
MKKIAILLIILMMAGVGVLSGCTSIGRSLKGTWKDTDGEIWKFMNNTVYISFESENEIFPYSIDGDKLYIPSWLTKNVTNQTGYERYYTMNWIDDETLELTTSDSNPYIEVLFKL